MSFESIAKQAASAEFRSYLSDMLMAICAIDTSPKADVAASARAEGEVFDILSAHLEELGFAHSRIERRGIDPAIAEHPFFSNLYYTQTGDNPKGLGVEEAYAGRGNLVFVVDGRPDGKRKGVNFAMNAHVDVVAPFIPPRIEGDTVFGRGACDDKGNVVAMMGAMRLVADYLSGQRRGLNRNVTAMFVIEEETGGNGSLSCALDADLKSRYDSLTVLEICENNLYPANRGCVWYKIEGRLEGVNLFEASAFIIEELEREGRAIRAESAHPLFPHRPVQTCHGIIGSNGKHPSAINADVTFHIRFEQAANPSDIRSLITDVIEDGLAQYIGLYGDKTKAIHPETGKAKVDHHYELKNAGDGFTVRVLGSSGHMGSILENDGAITKMACIVRSLLRSRETIQERCKCRVSYLLADWEDASRLLLEGGQGFLPTHDMQQIQDRMRRAAQRGAAYYIHSIGRSDDAAGFLHVTFDKLHNAAFAGDADSDDMRNAISAAKVAGIWRGQPIRGWDVSCDSRIFACQYPGLPVLTTGPGSLTVAHSENEQISVMEMIEAAHFLACFILLQTDSV